MIKRLLKCVRQYKKNTILTPIFVSFEVVIEVLIPTIINFLLLEFEKDSLQLSSVIIYGALLVVCSLVALFFGAMSGRQAAIASAGFSANIRKDMYYSMQEYSFNNIDKFSTSSLITRMTTDVGFVQMAFQMLIRVAVRAPLMITFSLIMSFFINPRLALVFLAVIPFLAIGLFIIMKLVFPIFTRVFKHFDKLNNVIQENIRGVRVVKSYVREDHEVQKFNGVSNEIYRDFSKATKILAFNNPLMQFAVYSCILLLSWFGTKIIVNEFGMIGGFTTSELNTLIMYIGQILMSLMMLSMIFVQVTIAKAPAGRICEVLNEKSDITDVENAVKQVKDGSIDFENVSFSYKSKKDKLCLSSINLHINSGETIGIIGGTGSSKTTLVQLISRLYDATEGVVKVGGIDVKQYDLQELRNQVAVVLQKNVLFSGTIKENLRWGNENATDEQLIHACKLAQADEFISTFKDKYDTYIEQGGANVSGGQKQRLCIARALLKKPKILILDDSTSAVDTRTDALIRKAFKEEIPNTTKLIIAQRISSVKDADKIIVLDGGKVNGFGTHEQLVNDNEIYREVYQSQSKGDENEDE